MHSSDRMCSSVGFAREKLPINKILRTCLGLQHWLAACSDSVPVNEIEKIPISPVGVKLRPAHTASMVCSNEP